MNHAQMLVTKKHLRKGYGGKGRGLVEVQVDCQ